MVSKGILVQFVSGNSFKHVLTDLLDSQRIKIIKITKTCIGFLFRVQTIAVRLRDYKAKLNRSQIKTFSRMNPLIFPSSHLAQTTNTSAIGEFVILSFKEPSFSLHITATKTYMAYFLTQEL